MEIGVLNLVNEVIRLKGDLDMQPNWESGFSRLIWVLSSIGLIILVIGLPWAAVNVSGRASLISKIESDINLYNLSSDEKKLLVERVKSDYPLIFESNWYSSPLLLSIIGATWFFSVWGLFGVVRWVIRGFFKKF